MEVGAVKQAYNNEVILLKKKLNQAKIQIIHKLTRKAKTLTEKKVPEKLKVKFTKKAESAIKEVLIIKKVKARDIAKFIVTHKGQLNEYLNRPTVDQDKACARLLLHKALQDKYKALREKFSNISINDLLMSRQERRKIKKEAREEQKNKKKGKDTNVPVQTDGDWNVQDVHVDDSQLNPSDDNVESSADEHSQVSDQDDESENDEYVNDVLLNSNDSNRVNEASNIESSELIDEVKSDDESEKLNDLAKHSSDTGESNVSGEEENVGKFVKFAPCLPDDNIIVNNKELLQKKSKSNENKKHKENNKNKNLKNKILLKKFNKEKYEIPQENKVVDSFFITATGENYMSVSEPRPPDEVKEVHKQGNRKYRRAVMFGHAPKAKPWRDGFKPDTNNSRFSKFNDNNSRGSLNYNSFDKYVHQKRFDKPFDSNNRGDFNDRRNNMNKNVEDEAKPEKLHPSWEAKKRQSGILPFQGKKIVFDEG